MKYLLALTIFGVAMNAAEPARVPVLAELFTSEGCSSCPPADTLLMKIDQFQPVPGAQIIVLSEHVDYWNSQGWKDPFSSEQFTDRQGVYAHALQSEKFTPQLVIDGRTAVLGSDGKAIAAAVTKAASHPKSEVKIVSAKRDDNEAVITLSVPALSSGKKDVWVAIADDHDQSSVSKGENAGKTIAHVAVVRSLTKVGTVSKSAGLDKTLHVPLKGQTGDGRVVVFVAENGGPVLGLAMEKLSPM
jgi:hypothetical protein